MRLPITWKLSQPKAKTKGFTLVELLVAIVITALMLTLVMTSYWTFLQTQQQMSISRELQSEMRFALNRIADKVRSSRIDYTAYDGTSVPLPACASTDSTGSHKLCLITPSGNTFYLEHADLNNDSTAESLIFGSDPASAQPLISPQKFTVNQAHFAFSPAKDPNDLSSPQMQPKVTIYLSISPSHFTYQNLVIESQTTVSSRQY